MGAQGLVKPAPIAAHGTCATADQSVARTAGPAGRDVDVSKRFVTLEPGPFAAGFPLACHGSQVNT